MPTVDLGALKFFVRERPAPALPIVVIARYECHPEPGGTCDESNAPTGPRPRYDHTDHLQPGEASALIEGANHNGGLVVYKDVQGIVEEVARSLGWEALEVDLTRVPRRFHRVYPCFRTLVGYELIGTHYDVAARVEKPFDVWTVHYPAGDRAATFRLFLPERYRFTLRFERDERCCRGREVPVPMPAFGAIIPPPELMIGPGDVFPRIDVPHGEEEFEDRWPECDPAWRLVPVEPGGGGRRKRQGG